MGDNLLKMVVQFATMDGLSEPLKRMVGLGKSAKTALGDLHKEAKGLKGEMAGVEAEMRKSASASMTMMERYRALGASIENVNRRIAQQKRLMAIDARTARITRQADAYKSEGMSGLMGAMMLAAPAMGIAHEVGGFQALQNKLTMLGLGKGAVNDLTAYSQAMNIAGSSAKDNLRYLVEAQGAFRESGEHTIDEQLRGAKTMAPLMAKMAATLKASGHEMSEDQERYFLRFVEQAGGTTDPKRASALTDGLFRAIQSSGGTVDASAYQGFLARAGTAGMKLSARTMFADFEPLIAELHDSAGVGLQGAYSRMNGMVKNQAAARELLRLGLWDSGKVIFNKVGGIKDFKNGANPLGAGAAAALSSDPVEFYRKYVLPAYQKRGVTDIERENMVLFGKSGGALFNLINKQLPTILRSRDAYEKTQSLDQAYNTTKDSFFGQGGQLKAAAQDFVIAAGSKGGLLENMTALLKGATGALRGLTDAANAHPGAFRFLATAATWLIGMRLATAGAKLAFGGLLGPVARLWGLWSRYRALGSLAAMFPRLASMMGLGIRGLGLLGRAFEFLNMKAVAGFLRVVPLIGRAFGIARLAVSVFAQGIMRAGLMMMANPMVLAITAAIVAVGLLGYVVYRNWDKITAAFGKGVAWVKTKLTAMRNWLSSLGTMMMDGLVNALNPSRLSERLLAVARQGITAFKSFFGIKSPSRLMMEMGGHIATGLGMGVDQHAHKPHAAMRKMATAVAGAGALALSPAAHARAPSAGRGAEKIEIHIHQQPGEDVDALLRRLEDMLERKKRASRLRSYEDDY